MAFARTVQYEPWVTAVVDAELPHHHRLLDLFMSLESTVARHPEWGVKIPGVSPPRYIMRTASWNIDGLPVLTITYSYTDTMVNVELIRINE